MNPIIKNTLYALLSAVLFIVSWTENGIPFLLFIAFVPLLFIQSENISKIHYAAYVFSTFVILGFVSFLWLCKISWTASLVLIWQPILMTLPFLLYQYMRKNKRPMLANFAFIAFWLSLELLFLTWDYAVPWVLMGNAFGSWVKVIQWYEYTGILGGTLWVLSVNILVLQSIQLKQIKWFYASVLAIALPLMASLFLYSNYNDSNEKVEVVMVQPNINPFTEKFPDGKNYISFIRQMNILVSLASSKADSSTDYIIFPETAIIQGIWEDDIAQITKFPEIEKLMLAHPNSCLITGVETYIQRPVAKGSYTCAPRYDKTIGYYDLYNSLFAIDGKLKVNKQSKEKLIPFYERVPLANWGIVNNLLQKQNIDPGLTASSNKALLKGKEGQLIAPVICYESIYGEHTADLVKRGAKFIVIITNDGWWDKSAGKAQFFSLSKIRAIETRRSVARCANTGITALIDQRGEIIDRLDEGKREALQNSLSINNKITFYASHGDYIGYLSAVTAIIFLLLTRFTKIK